MSEGEEGIAVFPSSMAYGEKGYKDLVPTDSPLIIQLELLHFRKYKLK